MFANLVYLTDEIVYADVINGLAKSISLFVYGMCVNKSLVYVPNLVSPLRKSI